MTGRSALAETDRICDAVVVLFAGFTVAAHVTVYLGAGLDALLVAYAVACFAAVAAWAAARRPRRVAALDLPCEQGDAGPDPAPGWQRAIVAALAATAGIAHWLETDVMLVWLSAAGAAIAALGFSIAGPRAQRSASPAPLDRGARSVAVLAVLSIGCAVTTLCAHRPDADDAFYLNLAVGAADHPEAPLLANDSLHGVPDVPLPLPVYKVHSLELLEAGVARLTGLEVLDVAHLALPLLAALLLPFAHARLLRQLVPERWLVAAGVAVAFVALSGGGSHGWQSFGLLRLHQGKAMLLSVAAPLVAAYALEFARAPSARSWLRLAAVQIAATGLSASALWLAPAIAGVALAAGVAAGADRKGTLPAVSRFTAGVAASGYVLLVAAMLRAATEAVFRDAIVPSPEASATGVELAHQAARAAMGGGPMAAFTLFAAFGGFSFCRTSAARWFCAAFATGGVLLWSPVAGAWIAAHVTSPPTYWRALWVLPMPALAAIALTAAVGARAPSHDRSRVLVSLALALAVLLLAPRRLALSPSNHVVLRAPGWQVPAAPFDAARELARVTEPGEAVLAARRVAPWVVALRGHPYPLVVRTAYLPMLAGRVEPDDLRERVALLRLVSGEERPPHAAERLRAAIEAHALRAVCLSNDAAEWADVVDALHDSGMQRSHRNADYQVWVRTDPGT